MKVAVVINSFDNNKKYWPVTAHSFNKYWKDCPYPIYFITNYETAPLGTSLKTGRDESFSSTVSRALFMIDNEVIIWTLEDYWFNREVNTALVDKYVQYVVDGKADYIRLFPSDNAQLPFELDDSLHHFNTDCMYKTSMGTAIWRKSLLQRLLFKDENIWQFELNSAKRTRPEEVFLTVTNNDCMRISSFESLLRNKLSASGQSYINHEGLII